MKYQKWGTGALPSRLYRITPHRNVDPRVLTPLSAQIMMRHFFRLFTDLLRPSPICGLALIVFCLAIPWLSLPSRAQEYTPSGRGMPGRREGGGTRGGCLAQQPTLTALMPSTNSGTTLAEQPTFFWYVPENTAAAAEFVLLNAENQPIYQVTLPISSQAGILSLTLPADRSSPSLTLNQPYRWYFSLICDPLDRSADSFTSGWIERIQPTPALTQALSTATPDQKPALYAEAGLWYDALTSIATLRQADPQNPDLITQWQTLLNSVDLTSIVDQPLLPPISLQPAR